MGYKQFRIICTLRVLFLAATIYLFIYLISHTSLYALTALIGMFGLYEIYSLIRYIERTNRDLTRFLQAIKYEDYSQRFSTSGLDSSFRELKSAFSDVLNKLRETRAEKEEHYRYLQTVVQHVGIGLISFREDGEVELINKAARQILNVPRLKNIKSLEGFSRKLVETLLSLKSGERALVKIEDGDETLQLNIHATEFITRQQKYTLVSIHNIRSELEEKEMEAWHTLIRVLTHEIMNSVTPIASLAQTVHGMLPDHSDGDAKPDQMRSSNLSDIHSAVQTIQRRSEGLLHFVESYRKLTRLPRPNFQVFQVSSLFERVVKLMETQLSEKSISFTVSVEPETLELTADPEMIEQVLINLLLNSIQALEGQNDARITLRSLMDERGRAIIQVTDNGPGILEEVREKIFIPFFTTKQEGTGIGLSLSRQVMRAHRGTISVRSRPNEETVFSLRF